MNRSMLTGIFILAFAFAYVACGDDSPSSPDTLTAPTIQSPENGSLIDTLQVTLTVGNAVGGVGDPTYRFELATDSAFNNMVAADEGVGQGSGGSTSWTAPLTLSDNQTYYWRSRASASGETGPFSPVASFRTVGGFNNTQPGPGGVLIWDPLTNGSSVGEVGGGNFRDQGWMATAADTYIRYEVPTLTNGYVEFDVTNLRNPNPRSDKRNLLIMWDPTAGDYTENRFRVHIAKYDTRLVDRWHVRFRWISQGQESNTGINMYDWDPNRVYNWRMEWGAFPNVVSSQRARVLLDGAEIMARNYDPIYRPSVHWIELGMAPRNETLEQAIFSNVKIGVRQP